VTLEDAVGLLAARAEKGPVKKKGRAAKKSANGEKKAPVKKTAKPPVKDAGVAAVASAAKPKRQAKAKV
jgi:hypothetical protein